MRGRKRHRKKAKKKWAKFDAFVSAQFEKALYSIGREAK